MSKKIKGAAILSYQNGDQHNVGLFCNCRGVMRLEKGVVVRPVGMKLILSVDIATDREKAQLKEWVMDLIDVTI